MYFISPQGFYKATYGKSIDVDGAYGAQCWDLFAFFCQKEKLAVNTYCNLTGYAGDLYKERYSKGYEHYFEFFYPKHAKRGDWIFWDQHVAMVWDVDLDHDRVNCLGQNQGGIKRVTFKEYNLSSALGCMRYIPWIAKEKSNMYGWIKNNDHWFYFRDGDYLTGWHKLTWSKGQDWFYFDKNGVMAQSDWRTIKYKGKDERFYFDENGAMVTRGRQIGGQWYYFDSDGVMRTGEYILTAEFDSSGKMVSLK